MPPNAGCKVAYLSLPNNVRNEPNYCIRRILIGHVDKKKPVDIFLKTHKKLHILQAGALALRPAVYIRVHDGDVIRRNRR